MNPLQYLPYVFESAPPAPPQKAAKKEFSCKFLSPSYRLLLKMQTNTIISI